MKQIPCQNFISDNGKIKVIIDNDEPVGSIHDFLMKVKGLVIEIMIKAHKEELAHAEEQKKLDQGSLDG